MHVHDFRPGRIAGMALALTLSACATHPAAQQDPPAVAELRQQAEAGDVLARIRLGDAYLQGTLLPRDPAEALHWFEKAGAQGDARAQFMVCSFYYYGGPSVPKDQAKAMDWCRKAAEQDYVKAESVLGAAYTEGVGVQKDPQQAMVWFNKAAGHDDAGAEVALGYLYATGTGVTRDIPASFRYFKQAADQGFGPGEYQVALGYLQGMGVPKDPEHGVQSMEKAASQGYAPAQTALGAIYLEGLDGIAKQPAAGEAWLRRAISQGHTPAECELGEYYLSSKPAGFDVYQALAWLADGANKGDAACTNDEAWAFATWPDAKVRDPHQAVELAQKAVTLEPDDPAALDTLAAAYAVDGQFAKAVEMQERAVDLALSKSEAADRVQGMRVRLELYRAGKPYIQGGN